MRGHQPIIVTALALALLAGRAHAVDYYVDKDSIGATCSDDGTGTSTGEPWCTIGQANRTLMPGDTVYVRAGIYEETIEPFRSGEEGAKITYTTYGDEVVLVKGEYVPDRGVRTCVAIGKGIHGSTQPDSYIVVDGFDVKLDYRTDLPPDVVNVNVYVNLDGSAHNEIRNLRIVNVVEPYAASDNCQAIENGRPFTEEQSGYREIGITINKADNNIIENNLIDGMSGSGIGLSDGAFFNTIRGNTVRNILGNAINITSSEPYLTEIQGNLIEGNVLSGSLTSDGVQWECQGSSSGNPACELTPANRGIVVRGNTIFLNAENGLDLKYTSDIVIEGNTIFRHQNDIEGCRHYLDPSDLPSGTNPRKAEHDVSVAAGGIMRGGSGDFVISENVIVRHNVIYDNNAGMQFFQGWKVYNNTVVGNDRDYTGPHSDFRSGSRPVFSGIFGLGGAVGASVKNNIVGDHPVVELFFTNPDPDLEINNNLYFNTFKEPELLDYRDDGDWDPVSFAEWQALLESNPSVTGNEADSLVADPLFVHVPSRPVGPPVDFSFHLTAESPAIDAGAPLTSTVGSGSGTTVVVADSRYFFDGYGIVDGDRIQIGTSEPVRITAIDHDTHTLTLASAVTHEDGDPVSLPYHGPAPDCGAFEYDPSSPPDEWVERPEPAPDRADMPPDAGTDPGPDDGSSSRGCGCALVH